MKEVIALLNREVKTKKELISYHKRNTKTKNTNPEWRADQEMKLQRSIKELNALKLAIDIIKTASKISK